MDSKTSLSCAFTVTFCLDINECLLGTSGCAQFCNNTVGSYTCSACDMGYSMSKNQTCIGKCNNFVITNVISNRITYNEQ